MFVVSIVEEFLICNEDSFVPSDSFPFAALTASCDEKKLNLMSLP